MFKFAAIVFFGLLALMSPALATTCSPYTYSFSSGTVADATQVNNNFNNVLSCANTLLAPLASPTFTGTITFPGSTTVTSAGNLGLANTSPATLLQIGSSTANSAAVLTFGKTVTSTESTLPTISEASVLGAGVGNDLSIQANSTSGGLLFGTVGTTRMVVTSAGNVGIGTTTPSSLLAVAPSSGNAVIDVNRPDSSHVGAVNLKNAGTLYWEIGIDPAVGSVGDLTFYNGSASTLFVQRSTGRVGIGTTSPAQSLHVVGSIRQTGCTTAGTLSANSSGDIICTTSDARLKNIVGDYTGGLDSLSKISPQQFTYKSTPTGPIETFVHAGFIAQNVMEAIPQAVALQGNGYYALDTTAILAASVNAIKQLRTINERQAVDISRLQSKLDEQAQRLAQLESHLRVRAAANSNSSRALMEKE